MCMCVCLCVDSGQGTSENPWCQTLHILMAVTTISRRGTLDLIWKIPSGSAGLALSLREEKKMAPMWGVEEPQLQPLHLPWASHGLAWAGIELDACWFKSVASHI